MMKQAKAFNSITYVFQENPPVIQLKPEPATRCCTVIVTAAHSEYAVFMNALRRHGWIDDSCSIIEMQHSERRFTYVHRLHLFALQLEDMRALQFLNVCPDQIILTGTARCFNVKRAPCDTVVAADAVLDMARNIRYECPSLEHWLDIQNAEMERGSYFSETDVKSVFAMQKENGKWEELLAFDAESCTFARICNAAGWNWAIVKAVTNDLSIPNRRMREYAAELAAERVIEALERNRVKRFSTDLYVG